MTEASPTTISNICDICTCTLNLTRHRPITCFRCHETACAQCVSTFLLGTAQDAHCMFCRVHWDRMFLGRVLTATFVHKEYKAHRERILYEREKCLLPNAMILLESEARVTEWETELRANAQLQRQLQRRAYTLQNMIRRQEGLKYRMMTGQTPLRRQQDRQGDATTAQAGATDGDNEAQAESTPHYQRPCVYDSCHGYINAQTGVCLACKHTTCVKCNTIVASRPHECQPQDIEAWTIIRQSTRPCPGCSTRITKLSGCSQMWCPQCHTAFNWTTGRIETGAVHNPHYYEWMFNGAQGQRIQARCVENNDGQDTLISLRLLLNKINHLPDCTRHQAEQLSRFHNQTLHFQRVEVRSETEVQRAMTFKRNEIRLRFLKNELPEKEFCVKVQRLEKAQSKKLEHNRILSTYVAISCDVFRHFVTQTDDTVEVDIILQELKTARQIANDAIQELNKSYSSHLSLIPSY